MCPSFHKTRLFLAIPFSLSLLAGWQRIPIFDSGK